MANYSDIRYEVTGTDVYSDITDLPLSGVDTGTQAFVSGSNRLYLWTGTGWYNIALINTNPSLSGANPTYNLNIDGSNTVVTLASTDPEGLPISFTVSHSGLGVGANAIATVTQSNNIFTFTPSTNTALAGTFTSTFTASDGVNVAVANSSFTLAFIVNNSHLTSALITSVGGNNADNNDFVDSSTNSHTITAAGNATQNTFSPYRHGGYSAKFDGTTSYFLTDDTSVIGTGDWTWEAWVRTTDTAGSLWMKYTGGNQADGINLVSGVVNTHTDVGQDSNNGSINIADGEWHYIVVERYNGTLKTFVDGTADSSVSNSENASRTGGWYIGRFGVSSIDWAGEIRDLRFSHNTAEYQGSFTSSDIPTETVTARASTTVILFTSYNMSEGGTATSMVSEPSGPYDYSEYASGDHGGSMYFDGTGDFLRVTNDNTAMDLTTSGSWTLEAWYRLEATNEGNNIVQRGGGSGSAWSGTDGVAYTLQTNGSAKMVWYWNTNGGNGAMTGATTMVVNRWYHIAISHNGTTTSMFINGVRDATSTPTYHQPSTRDIFNIGSACVGGSGASGYFNGSISQFRIVNGTAVYDPTQTTCTVPTSALTAITNTSLLLNGTNAGIIDKSQSVKTLTLNGDVKSSTTQTKYLSSSMYFDGTGDYISAPYSSLFDLGTQDFTVELWVNFSVASGNIPLVQLGQGGSSASTTGWTLLQHGTYGGLTWYRYNGSSETYYVKSWSPSTNTWYHVAVSRQGTDLRFFVNGTSIGTQANVSTSYNNINTSDDLWIGRNRTGNGSAYLQFNGYMSDIRITKGLARYTANFTPPTAALKG